MEACVKRYGIPGKICTHALHRERERERARWILNSDWRLVWARKAAWQAERETRTAHPRQPRTPGPGGSRLILLGAPLQFLLMAVYPPLPSFLPRARVNTDYLLPSITWGHQTGTDLTSLGIKLFLWSSSRFCKVAYCLDYCVYKPLGRTCSIYYLLMLWWSDNT